MEPYDVVKSFCNKWKPRDDGRALIYYPLIGPPSNYFESQQGVAAGSDSDLFNWTVEICLKSLRILGPLEAGIVIDLFRRMSKINLVAKEYLFRPDDPNDGIFIVTSGELSILAEDRNEYHEMKKLTPGESVFSALRILECISGHRQPLKKIHVRANVDSTVIKIGYEWFNEIWESSPKTGVRIIQAITTKIRTATLPILHHYFGFARELFEKELNSSSKIQQPVAELVAKAKLAQFLGLSENTTLLDGKVVLKELDAGETIVQQHAAEQGLVYVVSGNVKLTLLSFGDAEPLVVSVVHSGAAVGGLLVLTGESSFFGVTAGQHCQVMILSRDNFRGLLKHHPNVAGNVARSAVAVLSGLVRWIDFALDQVFCGSGQPLYIEGNRATDLYVVMSGRMKSVTNVNGKGNHVVAEFGKDDLIGWGEVLTGSIRTCSVFGLRDSELVKVPDGLLQFMKKKFPAVHWIFHILQHSVHKVPIPACDITALGSRPTYVANLKTVAIFPVDASIPLTFFTTELFNALLKVCRKPLKLTSDGVTCDSGAAALETINDGKLSKWLNEKETSHSIVLYQCDYEQTNWTKRCLRQADCVLVVAKGEEKPNVDMLKDSLSAIQTRQSLVFLWPEDTKKPVNTVSWLKVCGRTSSHFHVRIAKDGLSKVQQEQADNAGGSSFPDVVLKDFDRLGRLLTGNGVGVVFGGGGARGAAHVGVLDALLKRGVPIDFVGGVSIGSFVGGLYCAELDIKRVLELASKWFKDNSSWWTRLSDITWPSTAVTTGGKLNSSLQDIFQDRMIEDLWIQYFNVSTDITAGEMCVHQNGPLWRYCRASMSIAPLLPPLCDPVNNHELVDGGFVNNLPGDVMHAMGVNKVICIDVGGADETVAANYGDSLSGFRRLMNWILGVEPVRASSMFSITTKLATMMSFRSLEYVKKSPYCHYLRPPIEQFGLLDFGLFDNIRSVGFEYAEQVLNTWNGDGTLKSITSARLGEMTTTNKPACPLSSDVNGVFTDLAVLVKKVEIQGGLQQNGGVLNGTVGGVPNGVDGGTGTGGDDNKPSF